jgi:hypothetical protein
LTQNPQPTAAPNLRLVGAEQNTNNPSKEN